MMAEMVFVPLNGVQPVPSPEEMFYSILVFIALPMSVAMFGVLLLKWTKINTKLPDSARWLYPVLYIGFPGSVLLHILYTSRPVTHLYIFFFAMLSPPVFGFLQAVFLDSEKNGIYLLALVVNLFSSWGTIMVSSSIGYPILVSSFAVYFLLLVYITIRAKPIRQRYDRLFISAFFLTTIYFPTLVALLLL